MDADGHKWVQAKEGLPGVYMLDRGEDGKHASSKPKAGESMIRGLAPLVTAGTFPLHAIARVSVIREASAGRRPLVR